MQVCVTFGVNLPLYVANVLPLTRVLLTRFRSYASENLLRNILSAEILVVTRFEVSATGS